jgi:alpha-N-arabinofuranosidase
MTDPMGAAWRQTIYYPYYFASVYGRGTALDLAQTGPDYETSAGDRVRFVDVSGVHDAEAGTLTFFVVNRHPHEVIDLDLALQGFGAGVVADHQVMVHGDLEAVNTAANPLAVVPVAGVGAAVLGGRLTALLPPLSYQMLRVKLG